MTESRAIEVLEYSRNYEGMDCGAAKIALNIAIEALEKQIPKKVVNRGKKMDVLVANCPMCRCVVLDRPYCAKCGQKLDWSEV